MNNSGIFIVKGNCPISGTIKTQGNKNEALATIPACLLSKEKITFQNVPSIEDVRLMQEILKVIGAEVIVKNNQNLEIEINASKNLESKLPKELCSKMRGAITLAGPLLVRNKSVYLPRPGGDRIGRRRLDTHFLSLAHLGVSLKVYNEGYELSCKELHGADILLDEASVTGTENTLCVAVMSEGKTIIRNAASEPHVQNLCHLLVAMGAKIKGIGSNVLEIEGVESLNNKNIIHKIGPDYLEVGSFIILAALTKGELRIKDVCKEDMRQILNVFTRLGIQTFYDKEDLIVPNNQNLIVKNDVGDAIPHIDSATWPGFPADMSSVAIVAATQAKGTVLIHEKLFESRLFFTDRLIGMGARIVLCDPHRALIIGPSPLIANDLTSPDIRAGMALLIAAMCAEGTSRIQNIGQIDRGFENIDSRLRCVGANIERI